MPDIWDHYKVLKSDIEYVSKELRSARNLIRDQQRQIENLKKKINNYKPWLYLFILLLLTQEINECYRNYGYRGADLMKAFKVKRFAGFDFQVTGSVRKRYAASWNNVVKLLKA